LGQLQVAVNGLTGGVPGSVTVKFPDGSSKVLTASATLSDLQPGAYTINAKDAVGVYSFKPQPTDQSLTVTAGGTAKATVNYQATMGALEYQISGLLVGQKPIIPVFGPNSTQFLTRFSESTTLPNLAPGVYQFSFEGYVPEPHNFDTTAGFRYAFKIPDPVSIKVGETAQVGTVFSAKTGTVQASVTGLPDGAQADIRYPDGTGQNATISLSGFLNYLEPGVAVVFLAYYLVYQNTVYVPDVTETTISPVAGQISPLKVVYKSVPRNRLEVAVSGLPVGQKRVRATGPNGFDSGLIDSSQSFGNLLPGTYTITAQSFTVAPGKPGCRTYSPDAATQQQTLEPGQSATVAVTYTSFSCALP
jgi:hypothetical protein